MYVIVGGCGRVGSLLAGTLSREGHDVVIIDRDVNSFERLGNDFNGLTLEGFSFDEELLREAGIEKADAFVAVSNQDNTNLMAAEIATSIFNVPMVLSRLYYVEKELTFFKMGIDYVCSTTLTSEHFQEKLFHGTDVVALQDRPELGIKLIEFEVREGSAGRNGRELDSGINSRLVAALRGLELLDLNQPVVPLERGDRLLVAMRREGRKALLACLGEEYGREDACSFAGVYPPGAGEVMLDEPEKKTVVVAGCSAVGAHLAFTLAMEGHDVTVVDVEAEKFKRIPQSFKGRFVQGQVYDEEALLEAGIEEVSAFTVLTKFDNTNLMAAEVARHIYGVPKVVARLFNTDKEGTYQALGIEFVSGTRLMSEAFLERILRPLVRIRTGCFNNLYSVVEFDCPGQWAGRSVRYIENKMGLMFAYIARRRTGVLTEGEFELGHGDIVNAVVPSTAIRGLDGYLKKQAGR